MEWKNKKVLVNGVTGFIGSNLSKELLDMGAEIYSIDNFSYIEKNIAKKKLKVLLNKVKLINADVSKKETWYNVPKDIEYIFHFAGPSSITLFNKNPEKCYLETVFGFYNLLEFAKNSVVEKVIYPSTGSLYAGNKKPHIESVYPKPLNIYASAKLACEGLANAYSNSVKSVGLRIFAGYGPGEEWKRDFSSIIHLFIDDIKNDRRPIVFGDGSQTRDFVYIDDIVKSIIRSTERFTGIINVGTGESTSFNKIIEIINKTLNKHIKPQHVDKELNYVENLMADTLKMKRVLQAEPISISEGLAKFIKYLEVD